MCRSGRTLPADPRRFGNKQMMQENRRSSTAPFQKRDNTQRTFKKKKKKKKWKTASYHGFWDEKAVCCVDASPSTQATMTTSVWHQCSFHQIDHLLCTCRGIERIITCQEHTHKYCLFLARHAAASVWSLLKSPESGFKTSSCFRLA